MLLLPPGAPLFRATLSRRWCVVDCCGRQDLEHLYYGRPLPLEDDLTYLARANVAAPFDPQPVSAAEALGLRELNDLTEGDQSQLAERWRSFSSQRGSEVGPDGVPLKPRCAGGRGVTGVVPLGRYLARTRDGWWASAGEGRPPYALGD